MSGSRSQRLADEASAGKPRKRGHNFIQLSKALSYILRHGASKEGLQMSEGFVFVDELLKLQQLKRYSESDIRKVVDENDKKRFALRLDAATNRLQIRANQGHTMEVDDLELDPITDHSDAPVVVHGTYSECWELIKTQGLSRMSRNHIHFAPGEPGEEGVISDGFRFYRSANNVILCPGNEQGFLPPQYFEKVVQTKPKRQLLLSANRS